MFPLVLAAQVLRVLVPADLMMGGLASVQSSLCTRTAGKTETIELPAGSGRAHCDQCVAPLSGAPQAEPCVYPPALFSHSVRAPVAAQIADSLLARAQTARAPPRV